MYRVRGLGSNCPGDAGCAGNVEPTTAVAPDVQQQIADLWDSIFGLTPGTSTTAATGSQTFTQWVNANSKTVLIAGAVGLGLLLFAKAGR